MTIDVNADAGESIGRWILGNDEELLKHVTSLNAACGFHGGDPGWMRNSVRLAKQNKVCLGAHPGFSDLGGFGRRRIAASHDEIIDMVVYQTGALLGFARAENVPMTHVKPHGALNVAIGTDEELAVKVVEAILAIQDDLEYFCAHQQTTDALRNRGLPVRAEYVADMEYDDEGNVIIDKHMPVRPPSWVAERGLEMAQGVLTTVGGRKIEINADSLCVHGDRPGAADNAAALRVALKDAGIEVAPPRAIFAQ